MSPVAATPRIRLDDPRRETWPYRQGRADFHCGNECCFAQGSGAAELWAAGWEEEALAARYADEAEDARVARYFDERAAA